jgi:hypothetical protein
MVKEAELAVLKDSPCRHDMYMFVEWRRKRVRGEMKVK